MPMSTRPMVRRSYMSRNCSSPAVLRRSASSTITRSGGCGRGRCTERSCSRLARPKTAAQMASISRSMMRGVLVTPGVYSMVRQTPVSGDGMPLMRCGGGPTSLSNSFPVGIVPGRHRLAHPRHAIAQADVTTVATGIAELSEAQVLHGLDEACRRRRERRVNHSLK